MGAKSEKTFKDLSFVCHDKEFIERRYQRSLISKDCAGCLIDPGNPECP